MERWGLTVGMGAFLVLALLLPLWRLYRSTGVFGIVVHRGAAPLQRVVGAGFGATIFFYAALGAAVGVLGPEALGVQARPLWLGALGWLLFLGGLAVMVAAQAQMGASWRIGIDERPTGLVTHGLYAWIRNPIYTGVLTMMLGLAAIAPAWWTLLGPPLVYAQIRVQTFYEERHMAAQHPEAWRAYARRVGRYVPGVGRMD